MPQRRSHRFEDTRLFNMLALSSLVALLLWSLSVESLVVKATAVGFDVTWFGLRVGLNPFGDSLLAKLYRVRGFVTFAFEILPLLWLWNHRAGVKASLLRLISKRERRLSRGLCLECGYDIRASSDKCSECGMEITTPKPDKDQGAIDGASVQ